MPEELNRRAQPEPQAFPPITEQQSQWGRLYTAANALVAKMGYHGSMQADSIEMESLKDKLHDLDGGEWMPGLMPPAQPAPGEGHQAMWPQMIAALAAIDSALGLPEDGCNSLAQTLAAIRALKAQPEPAAPARCDWPECPHGADCVHAKRAAPSVAPTAPESKWSEPELWAEIHRLRAALKGPAGFDTWQDAATDERIRRVRAERALAAPSVAPEPLHVDETKRYRVVQKGYWWRVQIGDGQQTVGRCCSQTGAQHLAHALVVAYRDGFFVASQAAHPPRAPLTDAEIDDVLGIAYAQLVADGYTGGMGSTQWDHAAARAIEARISAAAIGAAK